MEQPNVQTTLTQPLSVPDREMFERVWKRVMSEGEPPLSGPAELPLPVPAQSQPVPAVRETQGMQDLARLLRDTAQDYTALSRTAPAAAARLLRTLAAEQQQSLRQLSAVCFLLTGSALPHMPGSRPPVRMTPAALRELFLQERQCRQALANAAEQTREPMLLELLGQLEERTQTHMDAIRRMLESL